MEVKEKENEIELVEGSEQLGVIIFEVDKEEMTILHTIVSPSHRGQGLAQKLVEEAIKYAKKNKLKIIPVCSYAVSFFEKNPQYSDILK